MHMRRLVVVALVVAATAGCGNDETSAIVASGSEAAAPTEATPQNPTVVDTYGKDPEQPSAAPTEAASQNPTAIPDPTAAAPAEPVSAESAPIVAAFEKYRDAVLAKDWEKATALVSRNIFEYYGRLRDDALYARIEEIDAMPVFDEMQLFVLRQLASPPTSIALKEMTPEQVVKLAFERKLIGTDMHETAKIEKVTIEGPVANGHLFRNGTDTGKALRLLMEPEGWRIDVTPFLELTNQQMDELAKAGKREKREYGQRLVEAFTGRFLDPALFEPPLARPEGSPSAKP